MEKVKSIALDLIGEKISAKALLFIFLLAVAILAPFLRIQLITGSVVNATLFIATFILGLGAGILISFLPSLVSAAVGLLPLPLLPMIPYIIIGNIILVVLFRVLKSKNFLIGVVLGSSTKFLFLFLSSSYIISFFIHKSLPFPIISTMAWPQLVTALIGGVIAFCLTGFLKRLK
jgi:riboflavin transporter